MQILSERMQGYIAELLRPACMRTAKAAYHAMAESLAVSGGGRGREGAREGTSYTPSVFILLVIFRFRN